jgi:hypothetical protein
MRAGIGAGARIGHHHQARAKAVQPGAWPRRNHEPCDRAYEKEHDHGCARRSASEIFHAALARPMWLEVHSKLLPTASAKSHNAAVEPGVHLLGHTGMQDRQPQSVHDGVGRVCSSRTFQRKTCANLRAGKGAQETLHPPSDCHAGRQLRSRRRTEALTDANPGNSRMGLNASCVGLGKMIAAWFHLLRRQVRR